MFLSAKRTFVSISTLAALTLAAGAAHAGCYPYLSIEDAETMLQGGLTRQETVNELVRNGTLETTRVCIAQHIGASRRYSSIRPAAYWLFNVR